MRWELAGRPWLMRGSVHARRYWVSIRPTTPPTPLHDAHQRGFLLSEGTYTPHKESPERGFHRGELKDSCTFFMQPAKSGHCTLGW